MVAGAVEAEGRQRVYRRLDLGDAAGGGFDQLERRDLALPQPRHGLDRGHPPEFVAHRMLLFRREHDFGRVLVSAHHPVWFT